MAGWYQRNRDRYGYDWDAVAAEVKAAAGWMCEACGSPSVPGKILTVDHLDHVPENKARENLIALCQVHHLMRQGLRPEPVTREEALRRLGQRIRWEAERAEAQGRLL